MVVNIALGNIRVVFEGEMPFSITQIGNIFILLEKLYKEFASYILEESNFSVVINNINSDKISFELMPVPQQESLLKFSDFQEIILCLLYSIYSSTRENVLETLDTQAKEIQAEVLDLLNIIQQDQSLVLMSIIDDKLVKIIILPDKKVILDKIDPEKIKKKFDSIDNIIDAYKANKLEYFVSANLENFELENVNLSGANFTDAELYQVILNNSNLTDVNFYKADVSNAHINRSKMVNAYLVNADFSGAEIKETDLTNANLKEADFSSANLSGSILYNVNIMSTDLSGSNLTGTKFTGKIKFDSDTDFGHNTNWWDADIEDEKLLEWLNNYYPKKNS
jgi:uncharacterized protein YjbI with pentapeptide repeats